MSTVQVSIGIVEVVFGSPIPIQSTKHLATPKTLTSSTTAAKPAISMASVTEDNASAFIGIGGPFQHRRIIWTIVNSGTDLIYAIFGEALTAGDYNTTNVVDIGHAVLPGSSREFAALGRAEEVVIIQAA
jgi:hypothetical protein